MHDRLFHLRDEILPDLVERLERTFPYAHALVMERQATRIVAGKTVTVDDGETNPDWRKNVLGAVFTVSDGTVLHDMYIDSTNPELLANLVQRMKDEIRVGTVRMVFDPGEAWVQAYTAEQDGDPRTVPLSERIALMQSYREIAMAQLNIINAEPTLVESYTQEVFVNRTRRLFQDMGRVKIKFPIFASDGDQMTQNLIYKGGMGLEKCKTNEEEIAEASYIAAMLLHAVPTPAEKRDVVLTPEIVGVIAHEAFGHGKEGDTFAHGIAKARRYIGKQVGSQLATMVADPTLPCTGHYLFDHNGQKAERVVLLDKGILTPHLIADWQSALYGGFSPTAHGRRQDYSHPIYSRQSYTGFVSLPESEGGKSFDEMIKMVDEGMLICGSSAGMEDPHGWTIQANGLYGRKIERGRITDVFYKIPKIDEDIPACLMAITAVESTESLGSGSCGKFMKEYVDVGMGGPSMLLKDVRVV